MSLPAPRADSVVSPASSLLETKSAPQTRGEDVSAASDQWHSRGLVALQQGNLREALACLTEAVQLSPQSPAAHRDLGVAHAAGGDWDRAAFHYHQALELNPGDLAACLNLASVYRITSQLDRAAASFRHAIAISPDCDVAHCDLGVVLQQQGQLDAAIASYRRALQLSPASVNATFNLGLAQMAIGDWKAAASCFRQALSLDPTLLNAHRYLAKTLCEQGQFEEAAACCEQTLQQFPEAVFVHHFLAIARHRLGQTEQALASFQRALLLNPQASEVHVNLGSLLQDQGRLDDAIACYRLALSMKPDDAEALSHLASALKDSGDVDAAIVLYQQAVALRPDLTSLHSQLLFSLHFSANWDAPSMYAEHRRYNERHAAPLAKFVQPHRNDPAPDRRLRIGYLSAEFCDHCLSFFTLPLLVAHDAKQFDIFCYSDAPRRDALTAKFQSLPHAWRDIAGLPAAAIVGQIHDDQIDILVDLTMHMTHSHLPLLALRPAPIQVTWLGYPGTTGLDAIDYRLTDPYLDPPELFDRFYSEKSLWLRDTFWCYDPLIADLPVSPLPAENNQYVTFGSLNNFCKTNPATFALWAKVLHAVQNSRLLLLADPGAHRDRTLAIFGQLGIARERIAFVPRQPRRQYLQTYDHIDVGLDSLPYNGHTTSLDAYWMGVPVISLVGNTVVGRAGLSQLTNLGLTELVATTSDDFVRIAANLATDRQRLGDLRRNLRPRMQSSPLMDVPRFARSIELAYRRMWETWCRQRQAG